MTNNVDSDECVPISEWPPPEDENDVEDDTSEADDVIEFNSNCQEVIDGPDPSIKTVENFKCQFLPAEKVLTRWLKTNIRNMKSKYDLENVTNPKTLINILSETDEGVTILKDELQSILAGKNIHSNNPEYFHILSGYYDRLKYLEDAKKSSSKCLELYSINYDELLKLPVAEYLETIKGCSEDVKSAIWLHSKILFELRLRDRSSLKKNSRKVVIEDYEEVSKETFKGYCQEKVPVLFNNVPCPTKHHWNLEYIRSSW